MGRNEAKKRKRNVATMREVLALAKETEHFTSDANVGGWVGDESKAKAEGSEFGSAIGFLAEAIVFLPRKVKTMRERLARAEAESVRAGCETCEVLLRQLRADPRIDRTP